MTTKKGGAPGSDEAPSDIPNFGMANGRLAVMNVENSSLQTFASGHGAVDDLPDQNLDADDADAARRDRYSPESLDRASARSEGRPVKRVNEELRADLLERPYLFATPEENGRRGIVAVWRSLKDQLRDETLKMIDSSTPSELLMHRRELESRRAVVSSVEKGIETLIERIDVRLQECAEGDPGRRDEAE